uniref:Uncharacterized protein n=1 Tax=Oryza glumipatula TaxID=40148 RepID=A0A0E0AF49_9ORYZ
MGTVRGSLFHFLKGTYNSPNGKRLVGGAQAVRMNAAGGRQLRARMKFTNMNLLVTQRRDNFVLPHNENDEIK